MRQAADELRAELAGDTVTFVVNRNINVSNICIVGCAFCGFGQGKRSPDAYEHDREEFERRVHEAVEFGATEICMQSGIHPDWGLEDYEHWLRVAKEVAPQLHLHAYSAMEVDHMCDGLRPAAARGVRAPARGRPGLHARHRRRGAATTACASGSRPNKLPVARWVEIIEAVARGRPALHRHGDVRPHRGAVGAGRAHARGARAAGAHRRLHRVRAALASSRTTRCSGRTHGIEEISREENLKHTAVFRLALGRTIPSLQASWVKMGLDAATEALRWGVNDLGGTLMEESISRMAGSQHGVRLEPGGPDRRGPRGGPPGGRAHHALRDPPDTPPSHGFRTVFTGLRLSRR